MKKNFFKSLIGNTDNPLNKNLHLNMPLNGKIIFQSAKISLAIEIIRRVNRQIKTLNSVFNKC